MGVFLRNFKEMIHTKMKTQSILFLIIFLLAGVTFCVKEGPTPESNVPPDSEKEVLPPERDSIDNPGLDSITIDPQVIA